MHVNRADVAVMNISVVVPAMSSNVEFALPRLLSSIEQQLLTPFETIVVLSGVDDKECASADVELQQHLSSSLLHVICQKKRLNQAEARNLGSRRSSCAWVSFVDADDRLRLDRMAVLNLALRRHPRLKLFLHSWSELDDPSPVPPSWTDASRMTSGDALYDAAEASMGAHAWVLAGIMHSQASVHRDVLRNVSFRTASRYYRQEDSIFVRDVIHHVGRLDDAMLFVDYPLGWHVPQQRQKLMETKARANAIQSDALPRATIVTAYFATPSKHTNDEYLAWMSNMLSFSDPMVIFTAAENASTVRHMREHALNRTRIITLSLEETFMGSRFAQSVRVKRSASESPAAFWQQQRKLDPEARTHRSIEVYCTRIHTPDSFARSRTLSTTLLLFVCVQGFGTKRPTFSSVYVTSTHSARTFLRG
jgi:hypothetical protein